MLLCDRFYLSVFWLSGFLPIPINLYRYIYIQSEIFGAYEMSLGLLKTEKKKKRFSKSMDLMVQFNLIFLTVVRFYQSRRML